MHDRQAPPAAGRGDGATDDVRRGVTFTTVGVVGLIVTQRFAIPAGGDQIALLVPCALLWVSVGLVQGHLTFSGTRFIGTLASLAILSVCTFIASARQLPVSVLSQALMVVLYTLACVSFAHLPRPALATASRVLVNTMTFIGIVAIALFAAQFVGVAYRDWGFDLVPEAFVQDGYNTAYPLQFGSDIYRSNGLVFLEPSFFSVYTGLALVVALHTRRPTWILLTLATALAVAASGNGVILVLLALPFFVARGTVSLPKVALAAIAFAAVAAASPLGSLFLSRSTEITNSDSSGSLRLVQPYTKIVPASFDSAWSTLFGHGAGSVTSFVANDLNIPGLLAPVPVKLLFEYGLVGTAAFAAGIGWILVRRRTASPWRAGLLAVYLVVNAALLQPTLLLLTMFWLVTLAPSERAEDVAEDTPPGQERPQTDGSINPSRRGGVEPPVR